MANPFAPYLERKKKKKDPANDLKKTKPVENKQEVQQPRRLNINTETQLEAMDKQVQREQDYKLVQRGIHTAREYTNSDGTKLYTKVENQGIADRSNQPKLSAFGQIELPDGTTLKQDPNTGRVIDNRTEAQKSGVVKESQAVDLNDMTDPNNPRVQENAIMNQGLREAGKVFDRFDIPEQEIYGSRADQFRDQFELQNARAGLKAEELDFLEEQEIMRLEEMQRQVKGAIGANRASFSQSREGVQASSVDMVRNQFEEEINRQLDARVKQHGMILKDINLKRRELEIAKKAGNTELAESLAEQLSSAQDQLRSNEIQYIDALGRQIDQQLKIDNQMMQKFDMTYGMMAAGQQFSQDQLIGMANEFGLPAEMMLSTYQSLEQVRQDKSLDQQQKQLQTQEILRDSQMRSLGYFTEQQQSAKMFMDMYQSGKIDKQQLGEMFAMSNIPSTFNPLTQAELAMQQAELQIQQRRLSGQPVGFTENMQYNQALLDMQIASGENLAFVPTESKRGMQWEYRDGQLLVDQETVENGRFHCGEFVNRAWNVGWFGDSVESKMERVTLPADQVNEMNIMNVVRPGMAIVQKLEGDFAPFGHVAIANAPSSNPPGVYVTQGQTVRDANGKLVPGPVTQNKFIPLSEIDGFVHPPQGKYEPVGGQRAVDQERGQSLRNEFLAEAQKAGLSGEKAEEFADKRVMQSFEPMDQTESASYNAYIGAVDEEDILSGFYGGNAFDQETFANSINVLTREIKEDGLTAETVNRNITNPDIRRAILAEMRWTNAILRKESGAAITFDEYSSMGTQFFPRAGDDAEAIADKTRARVNKLASLRGTMGPAGLRLYNEEIAKRSSQNLQQETDPDLDYFNQAIQSGLEAEERSFFDNL